MTNSIQSDKFTGLRLRITSEIFRQLLANPTLIDCKEGELVLITIPILLDGAAGAINMDSEARKCLCNLAMDGVIRNFTSLDMATTADGHYVYAVVRERACFSPDGGDSTL